ncbi:MAG: hypothetical protein IMZ53_02895 [Thermoplasmata archaeon]|nr:hypothetical protein [Thermoplasmata archaeon]
MAEQVKTEEEIKLEQEKTVADEKAAEKLEESVQEKLDNLGKEKSTPEGDESELAGEEDEATKSTPAKKSAGEEDEASKSTPGEDKSKLADGEEEDPEKSTPEDKKPADKKESGIPDAYRRAAIHNKWTDKHIDDLFKKDPELCLNTLKVLHDSQNQLSKDFAAIGRARAKKPAEAPAVKSEAKKADDIDIEKLRTEYGDDPLFAVITQLKQKVDSLEAIKPAAAAKEVDAEALNQRSREIEVVNKEISSFFNDDSMKEYSDFYGAVPKGSKDWKALTGEQHANRWAVLHMADEIISGAETVGQEVEVTDALNRAHAVISAPVIEKIIMERIKKTSAKRAKGISLQPAGGKAAEHTGPLSQSDLEAHTATRLAKAFNKH